MLGIICEIEQAERKAGVTHFLFPQEGGYQEIYKTYVTVRVWDAVRELSGIDSCGRKR